MTSEAARVRACFEAASTGFVATVSALVPDNWDRLGLGVWSVRDLVGHTSRSLLTIESYLGGPADPGATVLDDPVDYFRATAAALADEAAVAERGRRAGSALGGDPLGAVRSLADRVGALVAESPDDAPVATPVGAMPLIAYLPTRTFELAVHSLDLAQATGVAVPEQLVDPVGASLVLAARLAIGSHRAAEALVALTGRRALPEGFSVV